MTGSATRRRNTIRRSGRLAVVFALIALPVVSRAEIIDRVVAVVGQNAITASEVELQLRLEALFNGEPLAITPESRQRALQRLIAVRVIQNEGVMAGFLRTSEEDVERRLMESKRERYINGLNFEQALEFYDVKEQDVADFWRQVIGYKRFKDFRFKTGLEVSAETVRAYYEQHIVPEFKREGGAAPPPLDKIYDRVEEAAIEERANEMLEEWLKETRPQLRIVILDQEQPARETGAPDAAARKERPRVSSAERRCGCPGRWQP